MNSVRLLIVVWAIGALSIAAIIYANGNLSIRCQLVCPSSIHRSGNAITFRLPRIGNESQVKTLTLLYSGGAIILNPNKSGVFGLKSPESPGVYSANLSYAGANLFSISFAYLGGLEYIPYVLIGVSIFASIASISEYVSSLSDFEFYVGDSVYDNVAPYSSNEIEIERAIDIIRLRKSSKHEKIGFSELLFMMRGMHDFRVSPSEEIVRYMIFSAEDKHICDNYDRPPPFNYGELYYVIKERCPTTNFKLISGLKIQEGRKRFPKHRLLSTRVIAMINEGAANA